MTLTSCLIKKKFRASVYNIIRLNNFAYYVYIYVRDALIIKMIFFLFLTQEMKSLPTYITLLVYAIVFVIPGLITAITVVCFVSGVCLLIYSSANFLTLENCVEIGSKTKSKYSVIQISPIINKNNFINVYSGQTQLCLPLTWSFFFFSWYACVFSLAFFFFTLFCAVNTRPR